MGLSNTATHNFTINQTVVNSLKWLNYGCLFELTQEKKSEYLVERTQLSLQLHVSHALRS